MQKPTIKKDELAANMKRIGNIKSQCMNLKYKES